MLLFDGIAASASKVGDGLKVVPATTFHQ